MIQSCVYYLWFFLKYSFNPANPHMFSFLFIPNTTQASRNIRLFFPQLWMSSWNEFFSQNVLFWLFTCINDISDRSLKCIGIYKIGFEESTLQHFCWMNVKKIFPDFLPKGWHFVISALFLNFSCVFLGNKYMQLKHKHLCFIYKYITSVIFEYISF